MYKLIGFDPTTKGTFTSKDGVEIPYNNRVLKCITDNVGSNIVGCDYCDFKVKLTELASMLGCEATDEAVDTMLNSLLDWYFEPSYAIIKGSPTLNSFQWFETLPTPEKPIKPMSEVVSETRDKAKKGE